MRTFRLTRKGKEKVRVVSQGRDALLDYLYENKASSYDELTNVIGREVGTLLRQNIRLGFVEEVTDGAF